MAIYDCLGRTPFVSLVATILCCLGVGLFCGTLNGAIRITVGGIFEGLFLFDVPWLHTIQIFFTMIGVAMGFFSLMLLVFGFLATGATRQNIYAGTKCIMGGRLSAAFFLVLTFSLNLVWVGVTSALAMAVIIYALLKSICIWEIEDRPPYYYENYCLNLSRFGIYRNFTEGIDKNALCDETDLSTFCKHVQDAGPMYGLAMAGSGLIVIGTVISLVALAQNYSRIKSTKELTEYKEAIALDTSSAVM